MRLCCFFLTSIFEVCLLGIFSSFIQSPCHQYATYLTFASIFNYSQLYFAPVALVDCLS